MTHDIQVVPNVVPSYPGKGPGTSPYPLKVVCSCQWEALAINEDQATWYKHSHLRTHSKENFAR